MSALDKTAYALGKRDDQPNIELARVLAAKKDVKGIREIVGGLRDTDDALAGDCIKVLYEIGALNPELLVEYAGDFLNLLRSRNNRLVWGGMSALATVARAAAEEIYKEIDTVLKAFRTGSVITVDRGVSVLAGVCRAGQRYAKVLWPVIVRHLSTCRPKEVPQHAERALAAVTARNAAEFREVLSKRLPQVSANQARRINKVLAAVSQSITAKARAYVIRP